MPPKTTIDLPSGATQIILINISLIPSHCTMNDLLPNVAEKLPIKEIHQHQDTFCCVTHYLLQFAIWGVTNGRHCYSLVFDGVKHYPIT